MGFFCLGGLDVNLEQEAISRMNERLSSKKIGAIGGKKVASTNFIDGFKYFFEDDSWLLLRASGTEPLLRIYAEASSPGLVAHLLDEGQKLAL